MTQAAPVRASYRLNLRVLNRVLGLTLMAAAVMYFITVNGLSTTGFLFKELKQHNNNLILESQSLEGQVTNLASYQNLNQRIAAAHLVASTNLSYVSWSSQVVAQR